MASVPTRHKQSTSFRLSDEARRFLEEMAKQEDRTATKVLERAIRNEYLRSFVKDQQHAA
jgi:predicted transcriptional regulator